MHEISMVRTLCLLIAVSGLSVVAVSNAGTGVPASGSGSAYSVTVRHEGVDSEEMEKTITEILESELSSIPSRKEIRSVSEYGSSRVTVFMNELSDEAYGAMRDGVERACASFPDSAQRPEIASSGEGTRPAWVAAVTRIPPEEDAETALKAAFGKLKGAGLTEVWGVEPGEIRIIIDSGKASVSGLAPHVVSGTVAGSFGTESAGAIIRGTLRLPLRLDGGIGSAIDFADALIPSKTGPIRLGEMARVEYGSRKKESISRVNGIEAPVVAVSPAGGADLLGLSKSIQHETKRLEGEGWEFKPVLDSGEELGKDLGSTAMAALGGMMLMALCMPLLSGFSRGAPAAIAAVPLMTLLSAGLLAAFGIRMDRFSLAGLSVGIGTQTDTIIVAFEAASRGMTLSETGKRMKKVIPALSGGIATTLIALVPLGALSFAVEGLSLTAAAVAATQVSGLFVSVLILPVFVSGTGTSIGPIQPRKPLASGQTPFQKAMVAFVIEGDLILRRFSHRLKRLFVLVSRGHFALAWSFLAFLLPFLLLLAVAPIDFESTEKAFSVGVHAEFPSGESPEIGDMKLERFRKSIEKTDGVVSVQTTAKIGYGEAEISFDPTVTTLETVTAHVNRVGATIADSYFRVDLPGDPRERRYTIAVTGPDPDELERLARKAAQAFSCESWVTDTVLHFKEGAERLVVRPDREKAASLGLGSAELGNAVRDRLRGPVVFKAFLRERETDVRVMTSDGSGSNGESSPEEISGISVSGKNGTVSVGSVSRISREAGRARIYRKDRQRTASLSITAISRGVRETREKAATVLSQIDISPGYGIEFDRNATELEEKFEGAVLGLFVSALLVYFVIGAISCSATVPLVAIVTLPFALLPPAAFFLAGSGALKVSGVSAFVVLAGLSVNASLLVIDEWKESAMRGLGPKMAAYRAIRSKWKELAVSALVSILGSLPLVLSGTDTSRFMKLLALAAASGSACSSAAAVFVLPAVLSRYPRLVLKSPERKSS